MNPVLILTHNNLELTKKCVESVLAQDIPASVMIFDNGSQDGTPEWAAKELPTGSPIGRVPENAGVSFGWNFGLSYFFNNSANHVLVLNNDVVIPRWWYREALQYLGESHWRPVGDSTPVDFVTGASVGDLCQIAMPAERHILVPHPDFSGFLITRNAWEKIGQFDESLVSYCGDLDYHIRAHRKGINLWNSGAPFYHERSSTINNSSPKEKRILQLQADADRATFYEKYGCTTSGPAYDSLFDKKYFGVDRDTI
jgi:GT2 family glycosyltransferase